MMWAPNEMRQGAVQRDNSVRWPCGRTSGPYINFPTADGAARCGCDCDECHARQAEEKRAQSRAQSDA